MNELIIYFSIITCLPLTVAYVMISMRANKLTLRERVNGRNLIKEYLMMERKNKKTGDIKWVSVPWQKRIRLTEPPSECVEIGARGKKYAEAYRLSEDEVLWIRDVGYTNESILGKDKKKFVESFEPFSTTDRNTLVEQVHKAESQKVKKWLSPETIIPVFAITGMIVIVVSVFIFWQDIYAPVREVQGYNLQIMEQQTKLMQALHIGVTNFTITPTAPPELTNPLGGLTEDLIPLKGITTP